MVRISWVKINFIRVRQTRIGTEEISYIHRTSKELFDVIYIENGSVVFDSIKRTNKETLIYI